MAEIMDDTRKLMQSRAVLRYPALQKDFIVFGTVMALWGAVGVFLVAGIMLYPVWSYITETVMGVLSITVLVIGLTAGYLSAKTSITIVGPVLKILYVLEKVEKGEKLTAVDFLLRGGDFKIFHLLMAKMRKFLTRTLKVSIEGSGDKAMFKTAVLPNNAELPEVDPDSV